MEIRKLTITLATLFVYTVGYAQIKEDSSSASKENALRNAELIVLHDVSDAVNSPKSIGDIHEKLEFNLFDFSEEAIYIVNGKPLNDPKSLEYLLSAEKKPVKSVYISKYYIAGKRTVEVIYEKP